MVFFVTGSSTFKLTFKKLNNFLDRVIIDTQTRDCSELDSLCICCKDLCRLDNQVWLDQQRLRCVESEAEIQGQLVQGFREAGQNVQKHYTVICVAG